MMRIAVCDDDARHLDKIKVLLENFQKQHPEYPVTVKLFTNPFTLLEESEKGGGFELYLLDIIMSNLSGIDCAAELRERGDTSEIIFLTASKEYGAEAFQLKASNYLMKPVSGEALTENLLSAYRRLYERRPPVAIKIIGGELRIVRTNEIVYIESFNYYREILLQSGEKLKTHTTLQELREQFADYAEFYSPHRAYLVNLDFVTGINAKGIVAFGCNVPVPRGAVKAAQDYYLDYLLKK